MFAIRASNISLAKRGLKRLNLREDIENDIVIIDHYEDTKAIVITSVCYIINDFEFDKYDDDEIHHNKLYYLGFLIKAYQIIDPEDRSRNSSISDISVINELILY